MSSGPGRVEQAVRALLEQRQLEVQPKRELVIKTEDLCRAAFGDGPWTKAHRVSALRTMRRIVASEPTAQERERWRMETPPKRSLFYTKRPDKPRDRWLRFIWTAPPPSKSTAASRPKPVKLHEDIWAYDREGKRWSRAVITSRGGASPDRITIEWNGRKWQASDHPWGISVTTDVRFVHRPEFCRDRRAKEREQRELNRKFAASMGMTASGVSAEALAMLGLRRPFTAVQVQQAYRVKALKAHPDQGGDVNFMMALQHARDAALAEADD